MSNPSAGYIRSTIFSIGFLGVLMFIATPLIFLMLLLRFSYQSRYRVMAYWATFCIWWLRITCNIRYEIQGRENIPDEPVIAFAKHQSTWETLFLPLLTRRHQAWVLKQELMRIPFFGWSMAAVGPIPIIRGSGRKALKLIVEAGKKYLSHGSWVVIFPEGTRVAPGEKKPFAIGGAMLASKVEGYKVLPIAHNAGTCWPRRGFVKFSGTINVIIGEPLDVSGMSANQINQTLEAWMDNAMASIEHK
ncbi:MAG: 1-acyl-sn-glycerol-3-phosphate acyltransferase [Gammaproteobacteria bacterium]|nr:1-acyl-sn-glycerol-3-phosphate acyltransferase [Gammaproteobacteria bacterium]